MAVEIPVVIDIEKAFQDAAKSVKTAMRPLQETIDSAPASLFIDVNIGGSKKVLVELFDDAKTSLADYQVALDQVNAKIDKLSLKGGFNLRNGELSKEEANLLHAATLIETQIGKASNASSAMARVFTINMQQAEKELTKYTEKLSTLTAKQNKAATVTPTGDLDKSNARYKRYAKQIDDVNLKITQTRQFLAACSVELDKITKGSRNAGIAMASMVTPAQQMAESWRRGETYINRWNAALGDSNSKLGILLKRSVEIVALHSSLRFVQNIRQVTSEFEMQRVALGGIIQDTERAEQLFKQIKAAAIQSPFEIKDLVTFTKQLSAYRIETENLFDVTMRLADISAGLGVDMNRLVLAYGQVRAASVLRGQELRQFTEAGIPLVDELAKKFTKLNGRLVSTSEVFDLISKRAVPFSMIEEIFNDMTDAGGMFYKMQEMQSETLKGQWMKLRDAASIMYDEIGNTEIVHGAMVELISDAMKLMQNWREIGKVLTVAVASMATYRLAIINARIAQNALTAIEVSEISALQLNVVGRSKLIAALFGEAAATKAQIILGNAYVVVKQKEMMATNMFTKSLYKMIAALLANPYAAAVAGVVALTAAIIKFTKNTRDATISSEEFQKSIASFKKVRGHADDIDKLCDVYDELANKEERTREESEKLSRVTKDLAKAFPRAVSGADSQTKAIQINTDAIRENNAEVREAIRLSFLRDKKDAEKQLAGLQAEYDRISDILIRGSVEKGAYGGTWFEPITEDDKEKYGKRLIELQGKIQEIGGSISEADKELQGFTDDLIGPKLPEFFGDDWRMKMNNYTATLVSSGQKMKVFSSTQIQQFGDVKEAAEEAANQYNRQTELIKFYTNAMETATGAIKNQFATGLADANAWQKAYGQVLTDLNAWNLLQKNTGNSYQKDSFITIMENRIKFMKDFQKGYEDLSKYMSKSGALSKESETMLTRGLSLGIDPAEQKRAAEDLSKWYEDTINSTFYYLKKQKGVTGTLQEFLSKQITDTTNRGKMLKDFQSLLQSLFDAKTDFDTAQLKKDMEKALKKVSDEIKRSETARNFYKNILDLTGDEDLAATMAVSVYGDVGREFKDNLQKELNAALAYFDDSGNVNLWNTMREALDSGDFETIFKYMDRFPEEWQKRLKEMAESDQKYNAELAQNLLKTLEKSKTYGDKQVEIARQTAKRIAEINSLNVSQPVKDNLLKQNAKKEAEDTAKLQYEVFKDSPMYVELFANLDSASSKMLHNMRDNLEGLKDHWKNLDPTQLKELQSRIDELDEQIAKRNPFKAMIDSIKEYNALRSEQSRSQAEETAIGMTNYAELQKQALEVAKQDYEIAVSKYGVESDEARAAKEVLDVQAEETDLAIEQANKAQETASAYRETAQHIADAAEKMKDWTEYVNDSLDGIGEIVETFASDDIADTFNIISDGIGKTLGGATQIAGSVARIMAGDLTAIPSLIKGLGDTIAGVFGAVTELKIKNIDKQIKTQQDLLDDLEYTYDRLGKSMDKAFGSEYIYNYNKQLETLLAKQRAYEEQSRLEREKGKKADEDKIKEYENSARDAADQIAEMRGQLGEFFSGTDLTSAAEDFADAWIEAYKEFGSTTDAMSDKFNEMIQSMINRSLAAKIMQEMLQPIFDQIDEMSEDGLLATEDIASIAALAQERIPLINDAMTNLMESLAAAGLDVRTSTAGLSGISKDIAGASEESILGLAAGINTQNFYMSYVPTISENVSLILAAMTGGVSPTAPVATTETGDIMPSVQQMVYDHLPNMDENISSMLRLLSSVVTTKNGATNTAYIAVK